MIYCTWGTFYPGTFQIPTRVCLTSGSRGVAGLPRGARLPPPAAAQPGSGSREAPAGLARAVSVPPPRAEASRQSTPSDSIRCAHRGTTLK